MNGVVRHVRRLALLRPGEAPTDRELLESFLVRQDQTAFEALLRRHGPMVLGVCRRVLRHTEDAEDAFQATFLVLARKAGSVRPRELLGNWLYGVAQRTAMKARSMNAKRRVKERRAVELSGRPRAASDDLLGELDVALARLPDKYRVPVVLCELEGRSRKEVAQRLGLPEGTLSWRLAYAKKLLAKKLRPCGTVALAAALSESALRACVPPALLSSTARAAMRVAAGQVLPAGVVSTLTEGVLKAMLFSKLKAVWVLVLAVSVGAGAVGLGYRAVAAEGQPQAARVIADELDELRLEVAALRKGLETTRQRVKDLEGEVQVLKGRAGTEANKVRELFQNRDGKVPLGKAYVDVDVDGWADLFVVEQPNVPLAEAEAALKKLRANTNDKQAADALEKALKQLKLLMAATDLKRAKEAQKGPAKQ
jgi:RNA polymerase sigma-70 factor (ECF subfamily)